MKNCPNCGKELYDYAQRCDGCGFRGFSGEKLAVQQNEKAMPEREPITVDLPECPKLLGYYCSAQPSSCHRHIEKGVCYSCDDAIFKVAYHRKLRATTK